jgi:hypothetical protein
MRTEAKEEALKEINKKKIHSNIFHAFFMTITPPNKMNRE